MKVIIWVPVLNLDTDLVNNRISFSYSSQDDQPDQSNVLNINQGFSVDEDPTR